MATEGILERLATTDALTKLANRRRFDEVLQAEWGRAVRNGSSLALLLIDADRFKAYNDTYGHPAGDALLQQIASCIVGKTRRASDVAARYGGEEFAVLLPDTDQDGALQVAEGIKTAIVALATSHSGSAHRVASVSIGVAVLWPEPHLSSEMLIAAADAALYRAKAAGRNCCRVQEPPRPHLITVAAANA